MLKEWKLIHHVLNSSNNYLYKVNLIKILILIARLPADHAEPRESIIKRIATCDRFDIEIWRCRREFGLIVIHLAHQLQPLSEEQKRLLSTTSST